MNREDFKIGIEFWCSGQKWVCTDVGTRTIIAARAEDLEENPGGPPYSVAEEVFDEYDFQACALQREDEPWRKLMAEGLN